MGKPACLLDARVALAIRKAFRLVPLCAQCGPTRARAGVEGKGQRPESLRGSTLIDVAKLIGQKNTRASFISRLLIRWYPECPGSLHQAQHPLYDVHMPWLLVTATQLGCRRLRPVLPAACITAPVKFGRLHRAP